MKRKLTIAGLMIAVLLSTGSAGFSGGDGFNDVIKTIEQFYHVKHQRIPLLARVGMKAGKTVARIKGGDTRRLAEAGSVRVAFFEDQNFDSHGQIASFKSSIENTLDKSWSPLIQTLSAKDEEHTYIYIREAGEKFHVLVITIARHDATVVQATIAPHVLAMLMKDPNETGKALTEDATINDPEAWKRGPLFRTAGARIDERDQNQSDQKANRVALRHPDTFALLFNRRDAPGHRAGSGRRDSRTHTRDLYGCASQG